MGYSIVLVLGFPKHFALLVLHVAVGSRISGCVVDAMEAVAETTKHLSAGGFRRIGEVVYANRRSDQRRHFANPSRPSVRQIGDVYRQQVQRRSLDYRAAVPAEHGVQLIFGIPRSRDAVGGSDGRERKPTSLCKPTVPIDDVFS